MTYQTILLAALLCAVVVIWIFRSSKRTTVVRNPRLGMLDLSAGKARSELETDRAVLAGLFSQLTLSKEAPPACDVLLIYGEVEADGSIKNSELGLRELIRDSGAIVAVFASGNPGQHYVKANMTGKYGRANLVLTLDRKGKALTDFLCELFSAMKQGTSMPVAWVRLAPEHGSEAANLPDTIFACERGQVCFG
jgi:hypothetical protein